MHKRTARALRLDAWQQARAPFPGQPGGPQHARCAVHPGCLQAAAARPQPRAAPSRASQHTAARPAPAARPPPRRRTLPRVSAHSCAACLRGRSGARWRTDHAGPRAQGAAPSRAAGRTQGACSAPLQTQTPRGHGRGRRHGRRRPRCGWRPGALGWPPRRRRRAPHHSGRAARGTRAAAVRGGHQGGARGPGAHISPNPTPSRSCAGGSRQRRGSAANGAAANTVETGPPRPVPGCC